MQKRVFDAAVTRREILIWAIGLLLAVAAVVMWAPRPSAADSFDGRATDSATGSVSAAPVPEDGSSVVEGAYTFTSPTNWAFLATGANFPDALGAGAVAGVSLGPVLLVNQDSIPAATLAELDRLQPQHVRIVGGPAVVADSVLDAVDALSYTTDVSRLSGTNRFETAAALSADVFPGTGYHSRAGFDWSGNLPDGPLDEVTLLEISDFVTGDGMLLINAGLDIEATAGDDSVFCAIYVDGQLRPASTRWVLVPGGVSGNPCSTQLGIVVGAGVHSIELRASVGSDTKVYGGSLWALYTPFQEQGFRIGPAD